jgi:hypothetical protein
MTLQVIAALPWRGQDQSIATRTINMSSFWKSWMRLWSIGVLLFGAVLALGAFPATDGPTRFVFDLIYWPLDGQSPFTEELRFTTGLMGAVTIGWALTIMVVLQAAESAGSAAAPLWRGLTLAVLIWYGVDCVISVATGAAMNAASNTVLLALYLIPVLASGVLGKPSARIAA